MSNKEKDARGMLGVAAIFVLIVLLVACCFHFYFSLRTSVHDMAQEVYQERSAAQSGQAQNNLEQTFASLETLAIVAASYETSDAQALQTIFSNFSAQYDGAQLGIASADGIYRSFGGLAIDISKRKYFEQAMAGKRALSDMMFSTVHQDFFAVAAVPIVKEGAVTGAVVYVLRAGQLLGLLPGIADQQESEVLVDSTGQIIASTHSEENGQLLFSVLSAALTPAVSAEMHQDFLMKKRGADAKIRRHLFSGFDAGVCACEQKRQAAARDPQIHRHQSAQV